VTRGEGGQRVPGGGGASTAAGHEDRAPGALQDPYEIVHRPLRRFDRLGFRRRDGIEPIVYPHGNGSLASGRYAIHRLRLLTSLQSAASDLAMALHSRKRSWATTSTPSKVGVATA